MKSLNSMLSKKERNAVTEFKDTLASKVGNSLLEIILFGSKATGYSTPYSDLDLLVILSEVTVAYKEIIYDVAVDVNLKYDVVISPVIYSQQIYYSNYLKDTCFYKTTVLEGISI